MSGGVSAIPNQSTLAAFEEFFALLDSANASRNANSSEGNRANQVQRSVDDSIVNLLLSGSVEQGIYDFGKKGRDYVIGNFSDELREEIIREASLPDSQKSFFGRSIDYFKESRIVKMVEGTRIGDWLGLGPAKNIASDVIVAPGAASSVNGTSRVATVAEGAATFGSKLMNVAGAAYGLLDIVKNFGNLSPAQGAMSGLAVGAGIGSFFTPAGTLIGGAIGAVVGGIASLFKKSGKSKEQKERDQMRKALLNAGIIDSQWTIGLADGSRYNIGIDGKPKKEFGGRRPFEIDTSNPLAIKMYEYFSSLAYVVCGGNPRLTTALAGYLTNASLSNANGDPTLARENAKAIFAQFKISPEQLIEAVHRPSIRHSNGVEF